MLIIRVGRIVIRLRTVVSKSRPLLGTSWCSRGGYSCSGNCCPLCSGGYSTITGETSRRLACSGIPSKSESPLKASPFAFSISPHSFYFLPVTFHKLLVCSLYGLAPLEDCWWWRSRKRFSLKRKNDFCQMILVLLPQWDLLCLCCHFCCGAGRCRFYSG